MANTLDTPDKPIARVTFTMKDDTLAPLWIMEGQGRDDREMIAGLAFAIFQCVEGKLHMVPHFAYTIEGKDEIYKVIRDFDDERYILRDRFEFDNIDEVLEDMEIHNSWAKVLDDGTLFQRDILLDRNIGAFNWITDKFDVNGEPAVSYLAFQTPNFIRGFIMGCSVCGADFKDLTIGKPFMIEDDGTITYYDIQGYPIVNPPDMPTRFTLE